jgi:hypothetical protein
VSPPPSVCNDRNQDDSAFGTWGCSGCVQHKEKRPELNARVARLRLHLKRADVADRAAVNLAAGEPLYRYRQITMSRLSLVGRDWLAYLRRPNEAASTG